MKQSNAKSATQEFHSFYLKEILVSSAAVNGVLNGLIYFFTTKKVVTVQELAMNIAFTMVILAAILIPLYPAMARGKLKKQPDLESPFSKETHMLAAAYPKNRFLQGIISGILCTAVCTPLCVGLAGCLGYQQITPLAGSVIKGIGCGVCSGMVYYLSVMFVFMEQKDREKYSTLGSPAQELV